ncbi:hypothetical protein BH23ACT12_BH23ACT12_15410 [soil metagenome]
MRRTIAAGLLAAATALASLTASPALAFMRGDVMAPAATTATSRPVVNPLPIDLVQGFTVATNSVVATATVKYSGTGIVTVRWGDGTRTTYDPRFPQMYNSGVTVSSGTVVMKHEYAEGSGHQYTQIATVSVESNGASDFESRQVVVTPRYLVNQYGAFWSPLNHCDTDVETYTEWSINQRVDDLLTRNWREDRNTGLDTFPGAEIFSVDFRRLEGSQVTREMTMGQAPVAVRYDVTELDEYFNDQAGSRTLELHPSMTAGPVSLRFSGDGCQVEIKADVDSRILKPGLNQPVASASMG